MTLCLMGLPRIQDASTMPMPSGTARSAPLSTSRNALLPREAMTNSGFTVTTWWDSPLSTMDSRIASVSTMLTRETRTERIFTEAGLFQIMVSGLFKYEQCPQGVFHVPPGHRRSRVKHPGKQRMKGTREAREIIGNLFPVHTRHPIPHILHFFQTKA